MSYMSTPEFPVISWLYNLPIAVEVGVTYDGSTFSEDIALGNYFGFATNSVGEADADSLMGALATVVQDIMTDAAMHNVAGAVITGGYEWSTGGTIALRGSLASSGFVAATNIVITLSGQHNAFGLNAGSTFTISNVTSIGFSEFNVGGFFAPYQKTVYDEREYYDTVFGSEGISSNNTSVVRWGSQKCNRLLEFPVVYAAYVYKYRRELEAFSDKASCDVDDPNNLLQNLRDACIDTGTDFTLRVYQDDGEYREGRLIQGEFLKSLEAFIADVSGRGAMWKVSIPLRDLGTSVGGAI